VTEHQLLLFLSQIALLIVVARTGGELAARIGIPQVVGELVGGICLGPSLLGHFWPGAFSALFPADDVSRALLDGIGWIGVIFLVLIAGLETRLGVLRTSGRAVFAGWIGGFCLPFALGFALGWVMPAELVGSGISRAVFALFIATAMSISAIPVIARILLDLRLLKTRMGMVILSTALADDTVGWVVLAIVAGLATVGTVDVGAIALTLGGVTLFLIFTATIGQFVVRKALRYSRLTKVPYSQLSVILALVVLGGVVTQALHVHLVLGSFVIGVLIARSPAKHPETLESIRGVGMGFFVPLFFAYAGIKVDLTSVRGSIIPVALAAVAVACFSKLVGGGVGAYLGGLGRWEALAVGAGLNARGAMELVIAAIGLSVGIISLPMYSIIVLIAVVTTLMAAPMLRYCVARMEQGQPVEAPEPMEIAI
jgi:Kef-type K+ transport system membrane component KefB